MLQQQSHGMRMRPKLQRNKKQRRTVKHAHGRHARHARTPLEAKLALDGIDVYKRQPSAS